MMEPARFAKKWRETHEDGRPITFDELAQALRTPHNAPISGATQSIEQDRARRTDQAALAVSLRSPYGLASRDGDLTTMQLPTDHRLSLQVDR